MKMSDVKPWRVTRAQAFGIVLTATIAGLFAVVLLAGWATGALTGGGA